MQKNFHVVRYCLASFIVACCLSACSVKRPNDVFSDVEMENILFDYHIARAMGDEVPYDESYKKMLYVESVFNKYGFTEAQFDSSMVWFARNPEMLTKIYEKVNNRLKSQSDWVNALIAYRDKSKLQKSIAGDSVDVWTGERFYHLNASPLHNKIVFTVPVDSNFKIRDLLQWNLHYVAHQMDTAFNPIIMMQFIYNADTLCSKPCQILPNTNHVSTFLIDTLGNMKEVRGFIYYPQKDITGDLFINDISLMRYHLHDDSIKVQKDSAKQDSLKQCH